MSDNMEKGYEKLEIFRLSKELAITVHQMTLVLPKFEMYEEGSQIRRSAKSIPTNIAEGFGRRRYTNEYTHYLVIALASCDETQVHLDMLHATGNLDAAMHQSLSDRYDVLGKKLNRFLQSVIAQHVELYRGDGEIRIKEDSIEYELEAGY